MDERLTFILEAKDLTSGVTRKVRAEMTGLRQGRAQDRRQVLEVGTLFCRDNRRPLGRSWPHKPLITG